MEQEYGRGRHQRDVPERQEDKYYYPDYYPNGNLNLIPIRLKHYRCCMDSDSP